MTLPKIVTNYVFPPIPDRRFDWSAVYDGYEGGDPIGWGRTEAEAIGDLLSNYLADGHGERPGDILEIHTDYHGRPIASSLLSIVSLAAFLAALMIWLP